MSEEDIDIVYENGDKVIVDLEKVKFLSENLFPVRCVAGDRLKDLENDTKLKLTGGTTFLTDEAGLYTLISKLHPEVHVFGFGLKKLIEKRYQGVKEAIDNVPEPTQDERYYASGIFKVDFIADPSKSIIYVEFLDYAGMDTINI